MLVVTNRYTVHISVAMVAIFVGVLNLQTNEVRAETFGEKPVNANTNTTITNINNPYKI